MFYFSFYFHFFLSKFLKNLRKYIIEQLVALLRYSIFSALRLFFGVNELVTVG